MAQKQSGIWGYIVIALLTGIFAWFLFDLIATEPDHQTGVVVEKIFVPPKIASDATPYGGIKRGKYLISFQRQEQWIALVKMDSGDTVKVHCLPDHYKRKDVGDIMHFKKYEGTLLHIEYLAHNEEEDND